MQSKKSSTKEKNANKTQCKCGENCPCCSKSSVFPVCFLACMMTAALVSLCFAIGISAHVSYHVQNDFSYRSRGQFAKEFEAKTDAPIISLSASGAIDFFGGDHTGFIYSAPVGCIKCGSFEENLSTIIKEQGAFGQVYKYVYPSQPTDFDEFAYKGIVADSDGPVFLYVRNGYIYDRLDETNGDLAVSAFLAKYKK